MHHHYIDQFAQGDSPVHRLDARAKLLAVLAYTVVLISFDRYEILALAPLAIFPLAMLWLSAVPVGFALRRTAILSPFILMLCLAGPFYDRQPMSLAIGPWHFSVAGGYLTAINLALKFTLGVLTLTALMCTTAFAQLLQAMRKLGLPNILCVQLGFLYRYIFVLIDEAMRLRRTRDFRLGGLAPASRRLSAVGGIIGSLFVRTLDRGERIHLAMCARGYRGQSNSLTQLHFNRTDAIFLIGTFCYLAACRLAYPLVIHGGLHG